MKSYRLYVVATTRFIGFHRWPDALEEVRFLRANHRHEFHVKLTVEVDHTDRFVEFTLLKKWLDGYLSSWSENLGSRSCEDLCLLIYLSAQEEGFHVHEVSVFEDGENGALLKPDMVP